MGIAYIPECDKQCCLCEKIMPFECDCCCACCRVDKCNDNNCMSEDIYCDDCNTADWPSRNTFPLQLCEECNQYFCKKCSAVDCKKGGGELGFAQGECVCYECYDESTIECNQCHATAILKYKSNDYVYDETGDKCFYKCNCSENCNVF